MGNCRRSFAAPLCFSVASAFVSVVATADPVAAISGPPRVSIANLSVPEGSSGKTTARVQVTLSHASAYTVGINYEVTTLWNVDFVGVAVRPDNNHGIPTDVNATGGSLYFPPGRVSAFISLPIVADTLIEGDEQFLVRLTSPWASTLSDPFATVTILDDDELAGFAIGIGDVSLREGSAKSRVLDVPVVFTSAAPTAFTITTSTNAGSATSGTGGDFAGRVRTQSIAAGARSKIVKVSLRVDEVVESTEQFTITLTASTAAVWRSTATITIRDDDSAPQRAGRVVGPPRVALVGDSITSQYALTTKAALEQLGYAVIVHAKPGQGILDAAWCEGAQAQWVRDNFDPDVVVFENIGNFGWFDKCNPTVLRNSPEFFAGWRASAELHTSIFVEDGAAVWWILNPQVPPGALFDSIAGINQIYRDVAETGPNVELIDLYTPFGGDDSGCTMRSPDCTHLDDAGIALFRTAVVNALD